MLRFLKSLDEKIRNTIEFMNLGDLKAAKYSIELIQKEIYDEIQFIEDEYAEKSSGNTERFETIGKQTISALKNAEKLLKELQENG